MMTGAQRPADVTGYLAATLHASLDEKDAAFAQLEKAYHNREAILSTLIANDPRMDSLRGDRVLLKCWIGSVFHTSDLFGVFRLHFCVFRVLFLA